MPSREPKSAMMPFTIDHGSTSQAFPRRVSGSKAVDAALTHSRLRTDEPVRSIPPAVAEEVFGDVGEFTGSEHPATPSEPRA